MATAPDLAGFDTALAGLAAQDRFSGAATVTSHGDEIFATAHGYANRAWKAPCRLDTRFDTASMTKLFTAVAVLQLVERGTIGLGTSAVDYLELAGTAISPAVTVYHLLTHTSGIADDVEEEAGERYEDLFAAEPSYAFTEAADHLRHFVNRPPNFPPGQGCRYCNCGYILLGLMLERATGMSYRDYMRANVFAPADMTHSDFLRMDVVEPNVAEGVEPIMDDQQRINGWKRNIYAYPPIGDPSGGAYSTVADLLAFHRAVVEGRLLGPELTAAALTPHEVHTPRQDLTRMTGYGFEFKVTSAGRVRCYQKEGVNVGASGLLRHYPDHDLTLAILAVGEDAIWQPVAAFDAAIPTD